MSPRCSRREGSRRKKTKKARNVHIGVAFVTAFSVLTLLVVVGLVFPGMPAKKRRALKDLQAIEKAFEAYRADIGQWPRHACQPPSSFSSAYLSGYSCLFDNVYNTTGWKGPYLHPPYPADAVFPSSGPGPGVDPIDPWGECYMIYRFNGGNLVCVVCAGPNGTVDTDLAGIFAGKPLGDDLIVTMGN